MNIIDIPVQTFEELTQWRPHESILMPVEVRNCLYYEYESALLTNHDYQTELIAWCKRCLKAPRVPKPIPLGILDNLSHLAEQGVPVKQVQGPWAVGYALFLELREFAARWKLPRDFAEALGFGIVNRSALKRVVQLTSKKPPEPSLVEPYYPFIPPSRTLAPPRLPRYIPNKMTREEYLAMTRELLQQYCSRVENLWCKSGWQGKRYAHLRDKEYLQRIAWQAYWRKILRLSWGDIQARLLAERKCYIESRTTLKRTTQRAVRLLRLGELPKSWTLPER